MFGEPAPPGKRFSQARDRPMGFPMLVRSAGRRCEALGLRGSARPGPARARPGRAHTRRARGERDGHGHDLAGPERARPGRHAGAARVSARRPERTARPHRRPRGRDEHAGHPAARDGRRRSRPTSPARAGRSGSSRARRVRRGRRPSGRWRGFPDRSRSGASPARVRLPTRRSSCGSATPTRAARFAKRELRDAVRAYKRARRGEYPHGREKWLVLERREIAIRRAARADAQWQTLASEAATARVDFDTAECP